ncbi:MAG: phosphoribosylglycinamide formyltransferase [Anaerolineae bacterium]|nr:phosphoribosylglycinamide formyltransferase [Chloroflexota bacterium]
MKQLAVFVSGNGSNLQAIIDAIESGRLQGVRIAVVVCNHKSAYGLERAVKHGIPTIYHPWQPYAHAGLTREDYDRDLVAKLQAYPLDLIVLAGWMRIFSMAFLSQYRAVLNIHPALPGTFPGTHAIQDAWEAFGRGDIQHTGVMVHWAPDEAVDAGPVVRSAIVPIYPADTLEELTERVHGVEHDLYVRAIAEVLEVPLLDGAPREGSKDGVTA